MVGTSINTRNTGNKELKKIPCGFTFNLPIGDNGDVLIVDTFWPLLCCHCCTSELNRGNRFMNFPLGK